jgi:c-di-AMP phosphodiesterase-like protein
MGHRFSDLDCLGSCAALTEVCRSLGKTAYTVYDPKTTLANVLVRRYEAAGQDDLFIEEEDALPLINDNTVLIITDIHQPNRLDIPDVYAKAKTVVVIDHHRKMVEHITDAALFYHEPYSSSASEMVAELIQYMPDVSLIRAYKNMGGKLISIGSDAHIPQNVGNAFPATRSVLQDMGFDSHCVFRQRNLCLQGL